MFSSDDSRIQLQNHRVKHSHVRLVIHITVLHNIIAVLNLFLCENSLHIHECILGTRVSYVTFLRVYDSHAMSQDNANIISLFSISTLNSELGTQNISIKYKPGIQNYKLAIYLEE